MTSRSRILSLAISASAATSLVAGMAPAHALAEDSRPPEITAVPDRPGVDGWFDGPVTFTAKATEPYLDDTGVKTFSFKIGGAQTGQGQLSPTTGGTVQVTATGESTVEFEAYDKAFNLALLTVDANIDRAGPEIYYEEWPGAVVAKGDVAQVRYRCADQGSGVASCVGSVPSGSSLDTSTVGTHTFTLEAVDRVGRTGASSADYRVVDSFVVDQLPVVTGTPRLGVTLTGTAGVVTPRADGSSCGWFRKDPALDVLVGSNSTYTPKAADVEHYLSYRCTYTRRNLPDKSISSTQVFVQAGSQGPVITTPVVAGEGRVGATLTVSYSDVDTNVPEHTDEIRWTRDDVRIDGATTDSYVVTPQDHGHQIRAIVRVKMDGYADVDHPSENTVTVAGLRALVASGNPVVTGTSKISSPLTATLPAVTASGTAPAPLINLDVAWLRDGQPIIGATARTYSPTLADVGRRLSVRMTASGSGYQPLVLTSPETTPVAGVDPNPTPTPTPTPTPVVTASTSKVTAKALGKRKVRIRIVVTASGAKPIGSVTIRRGKKKVGSCALRSGVCTVTLKRQRPGRTTYTTSYLGTSSISGSSASVKVRVR